MFNFAIGHQSLPADFVYEAVKAVLDNNAQLRQAIAAGAETVPENATKNTFLPFHPGAARYYREKGIAIPDLAHRRLMAPGRALGAAAVHGMVVAPDAAGCGGGVWQADVPQEGAPCGPRPLAAEAACPAGAAGVCCACRPAAVAMPRAGRPAEERAMPTAAVCGRRAARDASLPPCRGWPGRRAPGRRGRSASSCPSARRVERHPGPAAGRSAAAAPRPASGGGEPRRRGRNDRRSGAGAGPA